MNQKRTYAVTGATGHVGQPVAAALLKAGHTVRAIGRNAEKLKPLTALGAQPVIGDLREPAFVATAMKGADAALLMVPPNLDQPGFAKYFSDVGENFAAAARATNLQHAVFISCLGSHNPKFRGLVGVHSDVENILNRLSSTNLVHVRAPSFFENLFYFMPAMISRSALRSPISPNAVIETTASADVAALASKFLLSLDFRGHRSVEVHGPVELSMAQIAPMIAAELGRPFPAEQAPRAADIEDLVAMGASREFATLLNDTWELFNTYGLLREHQPTKASRGSATMESFVRSALVPALRGALAQASAR